MDFRSRSRIFFPTPTPSVLRNPTPASPKTSGRSRPGVWWGGSQIGVRQKCLHLLKYQRLSATK